MRRYDGPDQPHNEYKTVEAESAKEAAEQVCGEPLTERGHPRETSCHGAQEALGKAPCIVLRFGVIAPMSRKPAPKDGATRSADVGPANVTLPPIDASPEEIAKALFKLNPEGETEKTA